MTRTTPAPESSTPCSCPNPHCARCHRPGEGHLAHRSWTGRHQHIARLRCTAGGREGSARAGPLRARSTLPAAPVIRLVPCQRWGVCEEGTAALGGGDLKTGPRCPRVAAPRAQTPHRQSVQPREGQGGHWDEAHATLRPTPVAWGQTAWAMGRGCRLGVDCGPRPQGMAATRRAQVMARGRPGPRCLTEGWPASPAALLPGLGVLERRRRRGQGGRTPQPRLVAPHELCSAPVVKGRPQAGQVVEGSTRVGCGGPRRLGKPVRRRQRGTTIQTACRERW
jgi:hypothetical protein